MDLPEPPKGPFQYSDISSFEDLYQSATRVGEHCVALVRQAGYQDTGTHGSLGVFLMATDSYEDQYIPEGVTPRARPLQMASEQNESVPIASTDTV
ncbi:MAG: hypothetical protein Q9205_007512 [Flavoplaca limonia]